MNKFNTMLMLIALVLPANTANAEVVRLEWTYHQSDAATGFGSVETVLVPVSSLGGVMSDDPNFIEFTATFPQAELIQNDSGEASIPEGLIGYSNTADCAGGMTLQWGGNLIFTANAYSKDWIIFAPMVFPNGGNRAFTVDQVDDPLVNDASGTWRLATWWGEGCDGHRHSGDDEIWIVGGPETHQDVESGGLGSDGFGDVLGVSITHRTVGTGTVWFDEVDLTGDIEIDISTVEESDSCPASLIKDAADLNGDCIVDEADLLLLVADWLDCGLDYGCP